MDAEKVDHKDTLYTNARLLDPASNLDKTGDLLIVAGKVAEIGPKIAPAPTNMLIEELAATISSACK